MNYFISMFIDNELGLQEKIEFLKKIRENDGTYKEAVALLEQEQMLHTDMDFVMPAAQFEKTPIEESPAQKRRRGFRLPTLPSLPTLRPFGVMASAGAMVVAVVLLLMFNIHTTPAESVSHRFMLYEPNVSTVEISGSFTNWQVLPLKKVGATGYWEIQLEVPKGEHRYSFILEKDQRIADPTVFAKESDDFGGENSILLMSV